MGSPNPAAASNKFNPIKETASGCFLGINADDANDDVFFELAVGQQKLQQSYGGLLSSTNVASNQSPPQTLHNDPSARCFDERSEACKALGIAASGLESDPPVAFKSHSHLDTPSSYVSNAEPKQKQQESDYNIHYHQQQIRRRASSALESYRQDRKFSYSIQGSTILPSDNAVHTEPYSSTKARSLLQFDKISTSETGSPARRGRVSSAQIDSPHFHLSSFLRRGRSSITSERQRHSGVSRSRKSRTPRRRAAKLDKSLSGLQASSQSETMQPSAYHVENDLPAILSSPGNDQEMPETALKNDSPFSSSLQQLQDGLLPTSLADNTLQRQNHKAANFDATANDLFGFRPIYERSSSVPALKGTMLPTTYQSQDFLDYNFGAASFEGDGLISPSTTWRQSDQTGVKPELQFCPISDHQFLWMPLTSASAVAATPAPFFPASNYTIPFRSFSFDSSFTQFPNYFPEMPIDNPEHGIGDDISVSVLESSCSPEIEHEVITTQPVLTQDVCGMSESKIFCEDSEVQSQSLSIEHQLPEKTIRRGIDRGRNRPFPQSLKERENQALKRSQARSVPGRIVGRRSSSSRPLNKAHKSFSLSGTPEPLNEEGTPINSPLPNCGEMMADKGQEASPPTDMFVNFTPSDSRKILTGVAPSGSSKTKARREREALERRRRLSEAAQRAVIEAGGDWDRVVGELVEA